MEPKLFVLHAHFYQPPRENPWSREVPAEPGAEPFHDWNERIDQECYRPNAFGRIVDEELRIAAVVNNYEHLSFNVGPTLVQWLGDHDPLTLQRMVDADLAAARRHGGHGAAIAQAWNHMILPLADPRDRATQVRWGLAGFRHAFGREAEAMWLPETAANHIVLDELIDHGLRFAILAPGQAARVRNLAGGRWRDVRGGKIDSSVPYLYRHRNGSGRSIAIFFYDGEFAHDVSFGRALSSSESFIECVRDVAARGRGRVVHVAADGETAGHHVAWGDRVLAHALTRSLPEAGFRVTNYGALLDIVPPGMEVELDHGPLGEGSSWSCAHGVGRWIRDCGCRIQNRPGWNQAWRTGLRRALDMLRDEARPWFEREAGLIFRDPWAARDDYVSLLLDRSEDVEAEFFRDHARGNRDRSRGLSLMEFQHQLLLQYTSCGWFFDDVGGIESRQVLRYAARALQLWEELGGTPPRENFLGCLAGARSNDVESGDGRRIFESILESQAPPPGKPRSEAEIEVPDSAQGADGMRTWLDAQADAGKPEELVRRAVERAVESSIDSPATALALTEAAEDVDLPLHLHRAQECWLVNASRLNGDPAMRRLGEALGFAPDLVSVVLAGGELEPRVGSGDEAHG